MQSKEKGKKSIYIAPFTVIHSKRSDMDHTVLPANNTTPAFSSVSVHQMSPPQQLRQQTSNCSSLLIYRPWKDERLSLPSWLTCSGWLTHISGHPSATSRAKAHRPKTDAIPLDHATNWAEFPRVILRSSWDTAPHLCGYTICCRSTN